MATCRRMCCFAKKSQNYLLKHQKLYSTGTQLKSDTASKEIVVPYRIERGPTDILKALASTIHKDYTAPHYKYEDDPYFIPSSNVMKRAFALSKESGRKAARYFLEKFPELFKSNESVPHIKAFDPPVIYTEENVFDVGPLKNCINDGEVDNAINVYNILKAKGIVVSQEVKQDLLDLLCFYNSTQPLSEDYYEERFFQRTDARGEKWNAKGMAEMLFLEMEKDNCAYSSMISGTAKFLYADRAMSLYDEMREKGFTGTVEAYNNLITVIPLLKEECETRWEFAIILLSKMTSDGLQPNLYTMNSLLKLLSKSARWQKSLQLSLQVLAEMRRLQIEPSLGSYHYLLMTFCAFDFSNGNILYEIMSEVENKEHSIRHPADISFFVSAMEVCWKGTRDKLLAYRIHNLLELKNNCKLLGNAFSENQYFKSFLKCLCETEEIDTFMEVYDKYVPNTYTPEPSVTLSVLETIHFTGSYKHLPKMCSDVLFFEHTEREKILNVLTEAAGCMKHEKTVQSNLVQIVWNILEKLNMRSEARRLPFDWTGVMLGNILKTFLNGKDIEKSWSVLQKIKEEENTIIGYPEKNILLKFCEFCLETNDYSKLDYCMKYAVNTSHPDFHSDVEKLVNDMVSQEKLSEEQRIQVNNIFQSVDDGTSRDSSLDGTSRDSSLDGTSRDSSLDGTSKDNSLDSTSSDSSSDGTSSDSSSDGSSSSDDSSDEETDKADPPNVDLK